MQSIRSWVVVLAVVSASAPIMLLGVFAAIPFFLATPVPFPASAVALGAFAAVHVVRTAFSRRLTSTERSIVRFCALAPWLVVFIAFTLGVFPLLLLYALGVKLGPGTIRAVVVVLLLFSTLVLWPVWLRLSESLSSGSRRGAA